MNKGWFKIHRELFDNSIWINSTPEQKVILMTLLSMASHCENSWEWNGQKFKVNPGQMVTSLESIANKAGAGISIQNIRTALKRFEKLEFLTNESTKRGRLITLVNWRVFQNDDSQPNKQSNSRLTNTSQTLNNYQELKKLKKLKNNISVSDKPTDTKKIIPPSIEEVKQYCLERKNNVNPEQFIDFYSAKNWYIGKNKMKDWQAAIRTWERKESNDLKPKTLTQQSRQQLKEMLRQYDPGNSGQNNRHDIGELPYKSKYRPD